MTDYFNSRKCIIDLIDSKDKEIIRLESDIMNLRKTLRMLDIEFNNKKKEKPIEIG